MRNLVAPVNTLESVEERIIEFKGLNRKPVVAEGEMSDMWNLTSDNYPLLTPRRPRLINELPEGVVRPLHLIAKFGRLGMIAQKSDDSIAFFYDGVEQTSVYDLTTASESVAINTKICFFPQKTYLEIRQEAGSVVIGDYKSLEASFNNGGGIAASVTISNTEARINLGQSHGFAYDDVVQFEGTVDYEDTQGTRHENVEFKQTALIDNVDGNTLVMAPEIFTAVTGVNASNITFTGRIDRTMPDIDLVIEWNNRLWAASNSDNTIYASKLGDPTNWQYFQGTSLDSYYAQQGTDERFTGIAQYSGHIIFFKPDSMCRIYGTAPSNYQLTNTKCYGVEDGSRQSIVTINDTVFYKSEIGIMAYDGGVPYLISDKFAASFKYVVAGTEGYKYYASCLVSKEGSAESALMVLDIEKGMWHKEDDMRIVAACTMDNKLYCGTTNGVLLTCGVAVLCDEFLMCGTDQLGGSITVVNPTTPSEETSNMEWMAVFGPFDEYIEQHKIYSKLAMRLQAYDQGSRVKTYISIDEGEWEQVDDRIVSTMGDFIPIVPRRCDRYSVKLEGIGKSGIKSLTRKVRQGSFGRL